jgi:hypothetical protein
MTEAGWTFLSNHGRVFHYLAEHPKIAIELLARDVGLSVSGVNNIIDDLEEGGYLTHYKVGRCNYYILHPELPMRHYLENDCSVGDILLPLLKHQRPSNTSRDVALKRRIAI